MPVNAQEKLSHLLVTGTSTTEQYISPNSGRDSFRYPQRQRETHGQRLLHKFESDLDFELKTESLEVWRSGTAVELAQRGHIAIFPVVGWWKYNPRHERWANQARYSLIVTIKTPETEIDLYTPVAHLIGTPVAVAIET